jgi:hypothetical protein
MRSSRVSVCAGGVRRRAYTLLPASIKKGVRNRRQIKALTFAELTEVSVRSSLKL